MTSEPRDDETPPGGQPKAGTVTVDVPVRVCDVGGWTDTWFAGHGRVCSLAVEPGVTVSATVAAIAGPVTVDVVGDGPPFVVGSEPPEHRLLAAAVREAGEPLTAAVRITVTAAVPPGSSLGTSAAVCVGIIAALDAARGELRPAGALALAAHRAEAGRLGRQAGVQDQLAAAHGGVNSIAVTRFPEASVRRVPLSPVLRSALDQRLVHIAYGPPHDSSAVHDEVIGALAEEGPTSPRLEWLRVLADRAEAALLAADLDRYGEVLRAATDAQAALHPALVSDDAHTLVELARSSGAAGWKVNGAGGGGGSISILCRHAAHTGDIATGARELGHGPLALRLAGAGATVRP